MIAFNDKLQICFSFKSVSTAKPFCIIRIVMLKVNKQNVNKY